MSISPSNPSAHQQREGNTNNSDQPTGVQRQSVPIPTHHSLVQHIPKYAVPDPPKPQMREQAIFYEKEKLLNIVARPEESWEMRVARVNTRRRDLQVGAVARWGMNLQDLDLLEAEEQRREGAEKANARPEAS